jgi:hypothetical protein
VRYLPRGAADDRPGHRFLPLATTGVPRDLKGPILLPSLAPDSTHSSFTTPHVLVSLTRERTSRSTSSVSSLWPTEPSLAPPSGHLEGHHRYHGSPAGQGSRFLTDEFSPEQLPTRQPPSLRHSLPSPPPPHLAHSSTGLDPPLLHEALQCGLCSILARFCPPCGGPGLAPEVYFTLLLSLIFSLPPSSRKALESPHFPADAVSSLRKFSDSISSRDLDAKKFEEFQRAVAVSGRSGAGTFHRR